ncbi:peptidase inhibitor family I36 protein [Streptomyces hirsutus]|uniref:peptidase inhibitor family I36 protein n=1 Tax=Streptomyces hirsutus TaxID=35620 RepID=UPI0033F2D604
MSSSRAKRSIAVVVATVAMGTMAGIAPVGAAEVDPLQQQIDEVLANTEGGVQISSYEIAWNDGEAIMAFPLPGEEQAPVSSLVAQKLQAQYVGLPVDTREPAVSDASVVAAADDDPPADEEVIAAEREPYVSGAASDSCPTEVFGNDWYCFYQYKSFKGRRLQWNATHKNLVYFSKFDFENRTSSWSNKGAKTIKVYGRRYAGQDTSCYSSLWSENPHERSASANWDNAADCFLTN